MGRRGGEGSIVDGVATARCVAALAQRRTTKDVCKQLEITEQTYYRWRKE
jgi:hypothetical protein